MTGILPAVEIRGFFIRVKGKMELKLAVNKQMVQQMPTRARHQWGRKMVPPALEAVNPEPGNPADRRILMLEKHLQRAKSKRGKLIQKAIVQKQARKDRQGLPVIPLSVLMPMWIRDPVQLKLTQRSIPAVSLKIGKLLMPMR